jgi:hypothetical protein
VAAIEAICDELQSPPLERRPEGSLRLIDELIAKAQDARTLPLVGGIALPLKGILFTLGDPYRGVLEDFDAV